MKTMSLLPMTSSWNFIDNQTSGLWLLKYYNFCKHIEVDRKRYMWTFWHDGSKLLKSLVKLGKLENSTQNNKANESLSYWTILGEGVSITSKWSLNLEVYHCHNVGHLHDYTNAHMK